MLFGPASEPFGSGAGFFQDNKTFRDNAVPATTAQRPTRPIRLFRHWFGVLLTAAFAACLAAPGAFAADGEKPYKVNADGKVNWPTFSGYRRYHSECHVCHGPAGLGSSFAPNLLESMKRLSYEQYLEVVVNGRVNVDTSAQNVMPGFATNLNVMCFVDDIYTYLIARADGAIGMDRPKHTGKPPEAAENEKACFGG